MPCNPSVHAMLAKEGDRISSITNKNLLTGDDTYALQRIPMTKYDPSLGENPRGVIVHIIPPKFTKYQPLVATGTNNSVTAINPVTGAEVTVHGNNRSAVLGQGEQIQHGYETRTRCLVGKPWVTGPYNLLDLMQKKAIPQVIGALRKYMPMYAKQEYHRALLDLVVANARYLWSTTAFADRSTGTGTFPCLPTGGANIQVFRRMGRLAGIAGFGENGQVTNGAQNFEVYMDAEDVEFAVEQYKKTYLDVVLNSSVQQTEKRFVNDPTFGSVQMCGGVKLISAKAGRKGVLIPNPEGGGYQLEEILPFTVEVAPTGGEGLVLRENLEFTANRVTRNGDLVEVYSIGYSIDKTSMERQEFNMPPANGTGATPLQANFSVNLLEKYDPIYNGANTDGWLFAYRMTHMFAPYIMFPELMTACIFIAAEPQITIASPISNAAAAAAAAIGIKPAFQPQPRIAPCTLTQPEPDPINGTCTDLFPSDNPGVVGFSPQIKTVEEGSTITIYVERSAGSQGIASVDYDTSNGTATAGTEYTAASGTLTWAAGDAGKKSFTITTASTGGDDSGKTITVTLSGAVGATLDGGADVITVTITDADAA